MRPSIRFYAHSTMSHVGFPNGILFRWGYVACSIHLLYRYSVNFTIKLRNKEYIIGFNIDKLPSESDLEKERKEFEDEES